MRDATVSMWTGTWTRSRVRVRPPAKRRVLFRWPPRLSKGENAGGEMEMRGIRDHGALAFFGMHSK